MKAESIIATIIALSGTLLFTWLLSQETINEYTYIAGLGGTAIVSLVIHGFSRLRELDLRNLKITLNEIKQVQQKIEITRSEIVEMYGGIENLERKPLVLDSSKMEELGLSGGGFPTASAAMRYPAGCIKRERERLARIFVNVKTPEEMAKAIVDDSLDDKVFKWNGPETSLDEPPKSVQQRAQKSEDSEDHT